MTYPNTNVLELDLKSNKSLLGNKLNGYQRVKARVRNKLEV